MVKETDKVFAHIDSCKSIINQYTKGSATEFILQQALVSTDYIPELVSELEMSLQPLIFSFSL